MLAATAFIFIKSPPERFVHAMQVGAALALTSMTITDVGQS
jgi:hypothetical protein